VALLPGAQREPLWPGRCGRSLTNCAGYRGAAWGGGARRRRELHSVGIDAEPTRPDERFVLEEINGARRACPVGGAERVRPVLANGTMTVSAKEAVYKTWFPLRALWLGFSRTRDHRSRGRACRAELWLAGRRWTV